MLVKEIMTSDTQAIDANETIMIAAQLMKKHDIGFLPVVENGAVCGVLTDRDIISRAVATGLDPFMTNIRQIMTRDVVVCDENDNIEDAVDLMKENQIRRLVVASKHEAPVGILSVGDLATETQDGELMLDVFNAICNES